MIRRSLCNAHKRRSFSTTPPKFPLFTDNLGNPSPFKKVAPRPPPSIPPFKPGIDPERKITYLNQQPRSKFKKAFSDEPRIDSDQESSGKQSRTDHSNSSQQRKGRHERDQQRSSLGSASKRPEFDFEGLIAKKKQEILDPRVYLQPGTTLATLSNLLRVPFGMISYFDWYIEQLTNSTFGRYAAKEATTAWALY
jgi:hypothetical protein